MTLANVTLTDSAEEQPSRYARFPGQELRGTDLLPAWKIPRTPIVFWPYTTVVNTELVYAV